MGGQSECLLPGENGAWKDIACNPVLLLPRCNPCVDGRFMCNLFMSPVIGKHSDSGGLLHVITINSASAIVGCDPQKRRQTALIANLFWQRPSLKLDREDPELRERVD